MSKYYAVKVGRVPGVYRTWKECQSQTNGFSGATFKSFSTEREAKNFCGIFPPIQTISKDITCDVISKVDSVNGNDIDNVNGIDNVISVDIDNLIEIYTDGSHQRLQNYLGIGAWCQYHNKEYSFSSTCNSQLLETYGISEETCSNPTAEFLAFAEVLKYFEDANLPKGTQMIFYIDYLGVKQWMEGSWKTKESYIKKIKNSCLQSIQKIGCDVRIEHVQAHKGIYGNEKADELAKDMRDFSNFGELIREISI